MKKTIIFIVILISIYTTYSIYDYYRMPEDERLVYKIFDQTCKSVYKKFKFKCSSTGAAMFDKIQKIKLGFDNNNKMNIDQARYYAVKCSQELINNVNKNEKIRPYLENYPFTSNNITVSISAPDEINNPDALFYVAVLKGYVFYYIQTKEDSTVKDIKEIKQETFDEAIEILKQEGKL